MKRNVLVAGAGGASLGTELLKCLNLSDRYTPFACDIDPMAYGLHGADAAGAYRADPARYVDSVIEICRESGITILIPGGEQPLNLLNGAWQRLADEGIILAGNAPGVVDLCTDKSRLFARLADAGIAIPKTADAADDAAFSQISCPCIVKPARNSGGSAFVFLAETADDARLYAHHLAEGGYCPILQEYLPLEEGEYTFSVLSDPDGTYFGSAGIRKSFNTKLFYTHASDAGLISSGYSQGQVGTYAEIAAPVRRIAETLGSRGPMNIEGRLVHGQFVPFEINPRFSASAYLWAMAGFNDVDYFLQMLSGTAAPEKTEIVEGYALRSFDQMFIPQSELPADRK